MSKSLLERIEKIEQNQAHFLTVLKDKGVENRMAAALQTSDLPTVRALIELGLHDVNATVGGRTPLAISLNKKGESYIKPECLPELAHYLLDAGADPLMPDQSTWDGSLKLLCSMIEPDSVDRLELLIRCREQIQQSDSHAARGVDGIIVTRAVMAHRLDLLTPEILAGDLNEMAIELSRDANLDPERSAMQKMNADGYSSGLKIWTQPLNYLSIMGTENQFKEGLKLGLPVAESSVYVEGHSHKNFEPLSTTKILETLDRKEWVFMLRSALARREAYDAIDGMDETPAPAAHRP